MNIFLLTHEREVERPTNTGALALRIAGGHSGVVQRVVWSRTAPNQELLAALGQASSGLLYPVSEVAGIERDIADCEQFVLLDATWQEARKMYNRSPYLHPVNRVRLTATDTSEYLLRRNQKPGGLCTAECVIAILKMKGLPDLAEQLSEEFSLFNRA